MKSRSIEFELPFGFEDAEGRLHRAGVMRIPTQKDMIVVLKQYGDIQNPAYLETLMLARIVESLGEIELGPDNRQSVIEALPLPDIQHLNDVYRRLMAGTSIQDLPAANPVKENNG